LIRKAVIHVKYRTALHKLASKAAYISLDQEQDLKKITALLVEGGLSPIDQDQAGQTFFHIYQGRPEVYLWMLKEFPNGDMETRDYKGYRPLHAVLANVQTTGRPRYTDYKSWSTTIRYLIEIGVELHARTDGGTKGKTPLDFVLAAGAFRTLAWRPRIFWSGYSGISI